MKITQRKTTDVWQEWEHVEWDEHTSLNLYSDTFPIIANQRFKNVQPRNVEDILWQNLVDDESEIVQDNVGVSVTQSIHYTKLTQEPVILTRWIGRTTKYGPEFAIGLGNSVAGDKLTYIIANGNAVQGVRFKTPISVGLVEPDQQLDKGTIGILNGKLVFYDGKRYREILLGDEITED